MHAKIPRWMLTPFEDEVGGQYLIILALVISSTYLWVEHYVLNKADSLFAVFPTAVFAATSKLERAADNFCRLVYFVPS